MNEWGRVIEKDAMDRVVWCGKVVLGWWYGGMGTKP